MMRVHPRLAAALALGTSAATSQAVFVYSSLVANKQVAGIVLVADPDETDSRVELAGAPGSREFDAQVGDAITLTGTSRFVTSFEVRIAAFQPVASAASTDLELNIFTSVNGLPGTLLWTGTSTGVVLPSSLLGVDVTFTPNITVPDSLVFSVAFANISNPGRRALGVATNNTLTIGTSPNTIVEQHTETQVWRSEFYGDPFANVQARVNAVPAPGAALVLGAAVVCRGRSRRSLPTS